MANNSKANKTVDDRKDPEGAKQHVTEHLDVDANDPRNRDYDNKDQQHSLDDPKMGGLGLGADGKPKDANTDAVKNAHQTNE